MGEGLQSHDAAQPSVEEVERVERDAEKVDERVVPARHQEKRDHVDHGKITSPVPHKGGNLLQRPRVVNRDYAKRDVGRQVAEEEDQLHPRGQRSDVEGRAELELAVVALAENRRILHILLEP